MLDEGGLIPEIHEGNNKGFNILGNGTGVVGVPEYPLVNAGYALGQCYPNPFNSITTIDYAIAQDARTTIKVFDQMGREVATLVDGPQHAGAYKAFFDGSRSPAGVYYLSIRSGAYFNTRKMVLVH